MTQQTYTELPYVFDLLYDIKSLEALHAHLLGQLRLPTSSTDADIVQTMNEQGIVLPTGFKMPDADFSPKYSELIELVKQIHLHAKRQNSDDIRTMDASWVLAQTGEVLSRQPGLTEAERLAYQDPSPFL